MRFTIRVRPGARVNKVEQASDGSLIVTVSAPPVEGKANDKIIEVLAGYFKRPQRSIRIVAGFRGKRKIVEID